MNISHNIFLVCKCMMFVIVSLFVGLNPLKAEEIDLVLPNLQSKLVKASDYKGKWIIVNYWATWCPPCLEEIPELNAFHKKHSSTDAVVLGVNIEKDDIDYVKKFAKNFKIVYPILIANDTVSSPYGHLQALPTTFILDKSGEVVETIVGAVTLERLEKIIKKDVKSNQ